VLLPVVIDYSISCNQISSSPRVFSLIGFNIILGKKLEEISIFSAIFCLAQKKQVHIWLKRILDRSTTHFDQVLPNKILLTS